MLKTSPILSPSANASPTSFRNASRSSQESASSHPSQLPTVSPKPAYLRRRLSTESEAVSVSASSSALSPGRSRRAGASTSDIRSPAHPFSSSSASPLAAPTTTTTQTIVTTSTNMGIDDSQNPNRTSPAQVRLYNALSPNKRRLAATAEVSSLDASSTPAATASSSDAAQAQAQEQRSASPQAPKRARPEEQPPRVLPNKYEFCLVEHMVELIAHMLGELIATNDAIRISSGGLTRFHSRYAEASEFPSFYFSSVRV